jgi:hypothetical protein
MLPSPIEGHLQALAKQEMETVEGIGNRRNGNQVHEVNLSVMLMSLPIEMEESQRGNSSIMYLGYPKNRKYRMNGKCNFTLMKVTEYQE